MINQNLLPLQLSGIRKYTNLAKETPGCIMLTIGEPDFDTPQSIKDAAVAALRSGQTHYAPNQGTPELRQAIAEWESARGYACTANQILVTVGATGALFTALLGILNPGEEVIVPTPAFPLYETIATVAGAKTVRLDISQRDFSITPQALEAVMTPKTRAIVLNSPNNPSGVVLSAQSLETVKRAVLGRDIYVICDNVYTQLADGAVADLSLDPELREQVLLCQSFSKPYAMTGWRVGYLAGPEALIARLLMLGAAQIASVPTFLQSACVTALKTDVSEMAETYRRRRAYVWARLEAMGLRCPEPKGAFYVFPDIRRFGMDSDTFCTRLIREAKVAAVPGSCFGTEGFIRLSYACREEDLREGLDRLEAFISTL